MPQLESPKPTAASQDNLKKGGSLPVEIQETNSLHCDQHEVLQSQHKVREAVREQRGYLFFSTYKIKFCPDGQRLDSDTGYNSIPYGYILKISEHIGTTMEKYYQIALQTKDDRFFKFRFEIMH